MELGLVGEVSGERGLARQGVEFELPERVGEVFAESPADDDLVARVAAGLFFHGRTVAPTRMSGHHPVTWFTQGESAWSPRRAWDYDLAVGQAW